MRQRLRSKLPAVLFLAMAWSSLTSAQTQNRTWVSSIGSDANPCIRKAPCATFQRAHDMTPAGGEINCVDSGDYGLLNIRKSITVDCGGALGSILIPNSQWGITVSAGPNDVVTLRNLSLNGAAAPTLGIIALQAAVLHLEKIHISGANNCLVSDSFTIALITVDDSTLSECAAGGMTTTAETGSVAVDVNRTRIFGPNTPFSGFRAVTAYGSRMTVRNSNFFSNDYGVFAGNSTITVLNTELGQSNTAALSSHSGDFILAFGNIFVNNKLDFDTFQGTIFTGGDNNNSGSTAGSANGGAVPKI